MTNLRNLRKQRGVSQRQLADALGCNQNEIFNYEVGWCKPRADRMRRICEYFGLPADVIFAEVPDILYGQKKPGRERCAWCGMPIPESVALYVDDDRTRQYCRAKCIQEDLDTRRFVAMHYDQRAGQYAG